VAFTLGALDQSPLREGGTAADALGESVHLAQALEGFGYRHYWVSEHHNTPGFAGTAPEILIGQIAARTTSIRVGSAGVMLSHYSALKVAETFRVLAAFHPGRIDLGVGRAPGGDPLTTRALAYPKSPNNVANDYPQQVIDLVAYLRGSLEPGHPFAPIRAQPGPPAADMPEVWLLGSSDYSARLAAALGLPYSFADFFGDRAAMGPEVTRLYREAFQPSELLAAPRVNVAIQVFCADSAGDAKRVASSYRLMRLRRRQGRLGALQPPSVDLPGLDADEREWMERDTAGLIVGDPARVRSELDAVAERYGTHELSIVTNCYAFEDRLRSCRLVAQAAGIEPLRP